VLLLLSVEAVQIAVGLWQARTGLPVVLVNIHMVLAVLLVAAMTAVIMHLKVPTTGIPVEREDSAFPASVPAP
jgi:cytochrome c oxidase assembly protein subunit 15